MLSRRVKSNLVVGQPSMTLHCTDPFMCSFFFFLLLLLLKRTSAYPWLIVKPFLVALHPNVLYRPIWTCFVFFKLRDFSLFAQFFTPAMPQLLGLSTHTHMTSQWPFFSCYPHEKGRYSYLYHNTCHIFTVNSFSRYPSHLPINIMFATNTMPCTSYNSYHMKVGGNTNSTKCDNRFKYSYYV